MAAVRHLENREKSRYLHNRWPSSMKFNMVTLVFVKVKAHEIGTIFGPPSIYFENSMWYTSRITGVNRNSCFILSTDDIATDLDCQ